MHMTKLEPAVRINTTIEGDAARQLLELKARGIFSTNKDAVVQSIRKFYEDTIERDLKERRLKNASDGEEVNLE
jgi:hypothetical protein